MCSRPLGLPVLLPEAQRPSATTLEGQAIILTPLNPTHADDIWQHIANLPYLWDYMYNGPFNRFSDFCDSITTLSSSTNLVTYAIIDKQNGQAVGYMSLVNIFPEYLRLEIGNVLFSPAMQRTTGATEAVYLFLKYAFELGYRRVGWSCSALNLASQRAAKRFGFSPEGVLRQYLVVKGRSHDLARFSMLRDEWDGLRQGMEWWLNRDNFDSEGRQRKTLEEIRKVAKSQT